MTVVNPHKDKRRWWVALFMLFPTGAGYIYVGRPWRFVVFTAFILLGLAAAYHGLWDYSHHPTVYFASIVIAAGFAIDLIVIAATQKNHDLRWPERRKWYVASLVLWTTIVLYLQ